MDPSTQQRAVDFATRKHKGQTRKGHDKSPYINHPIAVATLLTEVGGVTDPAIILAAILHDTVEDTDTSSQELTDNFGSEVSAIVAEVTDDKSLPKAKRKLLQIKHAPAASAAAKTIKLADKLCNIIDIIESPPSDWDQSRRFDYLAWSTAVIHGCRGVNEALEKRFDQEVATGCVKLGYDHSALVMRAELMRDEAMQAND